MADSDLDLECYMVIDEAPVNGHSGQIGSWAKRHFRGKLGHAYYADILLTVAWSIDPESQVQNTARDRSTREPALFT